MNNLKASYDKILKTINFIEEKDNFLVQIRKPKLNDKEVVSLVLVAEYLGIDSEYELFRRIPKSLSLLIERSVYNRRKRQLFPFIEAIRKKISRAIISDEEYHIIDSMPLEICKISRKNRIKICKENYHTAPNEGFCASQQTRYYGYKLHAVCTIQGLFRSFDLSKASVHDIHYLNDVKSQYENTVLLGDKGYLSKELQIDLFNYHRLKLEIPMRKNQKQYKEHPYIFMAGHDMKEYQMIVFMQLLPRLRKIKQFEVDDIIKILFEKISNSVLFLRGDFIALTKVFTAASMYEEEILYFLTESKATVPELCEMTQLSGISEQIKNLIQELSIKKSINVKLTEKEQQLFDELHQLMKIFL